MRYADMDKHVANETPRLVTLVGIVNKESRCRTIGALPDALVVIRIVPAKGIFIIKSISGLHYSLIIYNIHEKHDYLDDREDDHGQGWRADRHLFLVRTIWLIAFEWLRRWHHIATISCQ